jgi:ribonuclease E
MKQLTPSHARKVKQYKDERIPLFHRFQVENQLDAIHTPVVHMKSGGYIVLNQTEALVAIDVNSGRATKERHIEETALKTNLEAAEEVARQLRLRDLAGLVVVDFIDMDESRHNREVERRFKEAMKSDRARIQLGRISPFGLLEMSRQRLRPSLVETSTEICQHCGGTGRVRSIESTALSMLRLLEEEGIKRGAGQIILTVPTAVALFVLNQKRDHLAAIEQRHGIRAMIQADERLTAPDYRIQRHDLANGEQGLPPAVITAYESVEDEEDEAEVREVRESREDREEGGSRRRRSKRGGRNRRRGDRDERPREAQESAEETSQEEAAEEQEDEQQDREAASGEGEADRGGRKRRRRGKRGGRRRSRRRDENQPQEGQEEAAQADQEAAAVEPKSESAPDEAETTAEPAEVEAAPAEAQEEKPKRSRSRKKKAEAAEQAPEEAKAEKPKRSRSRKKKDEQPAEAAPAEAEAASPQPEEQTQESQPEPKPEEPKEEVPAELETVGASSENGAGKAGESGDETPGVVIDVDAAKESKPKKVGWWRRP